MIQVSNLEEYQSLVKKNRNEKKAKKTNCLLFPDAIQRYIDYGRFFYEEQEAGIFFFADEDRYYQAWFYLNPEIPAEKRKWDKPVLVQHYYTEKNRDRDQNVYAQLEAAGFRHMDTMQHFLADSEKAIRKIQPLARYAEKMMQENGFTYRPPEDSELPLVDQLLDMTPELPYYLLDWHSRKELDEMREEGRFAGIFNKTGELCAAHMFFVSGNILNGWVVVKEEYREVYGMSVFLKNKTMNYAIEHHCVHSGWIDLKNTVSRRYHQSAGYTADDRFLDNWVC